MSDQDLLPPDRQPPPTDDPETETPEVQDNGLPVPEPPVTVLPSNPEVTYTRRVRPRLQADAAQYVPQTRTGCADLITAFFVLASIGALAFTILLIANPYSALNPFPPGSTLVVYVIASPMPTATPTQTFTSLPPTPTLPTETPTPTATPTETLTPTITFTPVFDSLPDGSRTTPDGPTSTPAPNYTRSPFPFTVEVIRYEQYDGTEACNWQSVAGAVTDLSAQPIAGIAIQIISADGAINEFHYTGDQDGARRFGTGGFEIYLGDQPARGAYTIQLRGRSGAAISEPILVETRAECEENVTIIRFVQNHLY